MMITIWSPGELRWWLSERWPLNDEGAATAWCGFDCVPLRAYFPCSRSSSNARPFSGLELEVLLTIIKSSGDLSLYIRFCFFPSMICLLGEEIWKAIFKIGNKTIHVFQEHLRVVLVVTFLVPAHSPDSSSLTFVLLRQWTLKSENFLCKNISDGFYTQTHVHGLLLSFNVLTVSY